MCVFAVMAARKQGLNDPSVHSSGLQRLRLRRQHSALRKRSLGIRRYDRFFKEIGRSRTARSCGSETSVHSDKE